MALEYYTNLTSVASHFLQKIKVPVSQKSLDSLFFTNPYYPSLYSLNNVFNKFKIDNKSLKVELEQLDDLPLPFLTHYYIEEIGAKDFINVTDVTEDSVTYFYKKEITIAKNVFLEKWSKIVFLAQPNNESKDVDYDKNKKEEVNNKVKSLLLAAGYGFVLLFGLYFFIASSNDFVGAIMFVFSVLIGLIISVLLLIYEVDKSNDFVKSICEGGVKTNCDAVLTSSESKLFSISWSEYGFFYFGFLALYLLIPFSSFLEKKPIITYLSILTSFYIPFSIYYQYKIVKQWCRLCLMIQTVLLFNFIWTLFFGNFEFQFSKPNIFGFFICGFFPIIVWYSLKPLIVKSLKSEEYYGSWRRLFNHQDVFNLTLNEQPNAPIGYESLGLHKGNSDAKNIIIKICSPTCTPCAKAYKLFNDILSTNKDCQIITIYEVGDSEDAFSRIFVKHMFALNDMEDKKLLNNAMDYWYLNENRTYEELVEKFPVPKELLDMHTEKIIAMNEWCKNAEVQYTPTVYLNNKKLPKTFNLNELKNIL
ncbi:MAG: vitamin K epoxide reductase family protein [Bacteroidota bacterium]